MVKELGIHCDAWVGHQSYVANRDPSVSHMIFDTRKEAQQAGWKTPSRVRMYLLDNKA